MAALLSCAIGSIVLAHAQSRWPQGVGAFTKQDGRWQILLFIAGD